MDANAVLTKFDEAVNLFAQGNHVGATTTLNNIQQIPSTQLVPLFMQHVILGGDGKHDLLAIARHFVRENGGAFPSLVEAFGFTVQRHFYAFRLIAHGVTGDYSGVWRPQFEGMVQSVEQYLALNTSILTANGGSFQASDNLDGANLARMARPLTSEISTLWAVLWKLEVSSVTTAFLSPSSDGSTSEANVNAIMERLGSRLEEMLFAAPTPELSTIMCLLVTSACEEFGLSHKTAAQRGIPIGTHVQVRQRFAVAVLPRVASAAFQILDQKTRLGYSSTITNANYSALAGAARLLAVIFSWRFRNFSICGSASCDLLSSEQSTTPEVLDLANDRWRVVLEESYKEVKEGNSAVSVNSPLDIFHRLLNSTMLLCGYQYSERATASGVSSLLMDSARADVLFIFVQTCSIVCEFWSNDAKAFYGQCAWRAALCLCNSEISGGRPEVVTTACAALRRVLHSMEITPLVFVRESAIEEFITPLTNLTTTVINQIGEAETAAANKFHNRQSGSLLVSFDGDEGANGACDVLLEGLNHLLNAWLALVRGALEDIPVRSTLPDSVATAIGSGAAEVLKTFVTAKINLHSSRALLAEDGTEAPESSHAIEYGNSSTQLLAVISREDAPSVCTFLLEQLSGLSKLYVESYLGQGIEAPMALNEALWYVIAVTAEYIGPKGDSERPCIPSAFLNLGIRCEKQWPEDVGAQIAGNPFFNLCGGVFRFAETLMEHILRGTVSPGVCQAVLDALARYCGTYLLPDPFSQMERVVAFESVFSNGTDAARVILSFLAASLKVYGLDPDVAESAVSILQALLRLPREFSQWILSGDGACLPASLGNCEGANWFDFFASCAVGGGMQLPSTLRGKLIGFLLSIAGWASMEDLEAATGGAMGGFGCFGGDDSNKPVLTAEISAQTAVGRFAAHVCAVLSTELKTASISNTIAVLEIVGSLVEGLSMPLIVNAATLSGLGTLITSSATAACELHSKTASSSSSSSASDLMLLKEGANMLEHVLVGVGCYFDTDTYTMVARAALEATRYAGNVIRHVVTRSVTTSGVTNEKGGVAMLSDGGAAVELLTSVAKMVLGIASWGASDFSSQSNAALSERNSVVAQVSVEGLCITLSFFDETSALIPELRDEIFRLMKAVASSYTGPMIAMMPQESSQALLQSLNFAFNSGVPDLIERGCAVVQAFAAHYYEQNGRRPCPPCLEKGGAYTILGNLLKGFLHHLTWMTLCSAIDNTVTSCVASAILDVAKALGPEQVVETFRVESARHCPAIAPAIDVFFNAVCNLDINSSRRDIRSRFTLSVEELMTTAQGTRHLIA